MFVTIYKEMCYLGFNESVEWDSRWEAREERNLWINSLSNIWQTENWAGREGWNGSLTRGLGAWWETLARPWGAVRDSLKPARHPFPWYSSPSSWVIFLKDSFPLNSYHPESVINEGSQGRFISPTANQSNLMYSFLGFHVDHEVPQKEMNKIYKKEEKSFFFLPCTIHIWYKLLRN